MTFDCPSILDSWMALAACPWGNGKPHWPQKCGRGGGRVMMEISVFGLSMGSHFGRRNEGARRRGRPGSLWGIMVRDWQKLYVGVTNTPTTNHTHRPSSDLCERSTADLPPTQPPIGPDALPLPQSRHPAARSNLSSGRACRTRFSRTATPREATVLTKARTQNAVARGMPMRTRRKTSWSRRTKV